MRLHRKRLNAILAVSVLSLLISSSWTILSSAEESGGIAITEIAYRGTGVDACNGEDWIELHSTLDTAIDMGGWMIYDDNGVFDEDAWVIPDGYTVAPGEYKVVCREQDFLFGIGSDDSVFVMDSDGFIVDQVTLAPGGPDNDATYALFDEKDKKFEYTTSPTPGKVNILTEAVPLMTQFVDNNKAAESFFSMKGDMGAVVDINVTIGEEELKMITEHAGWEEYTPFETFTIGSSAEKSQKVVTSESAGDIRVRGQSTNTITTCLGFQNKPFLVRFNSPFMGLDSIYLRNHLGDKSFLKDHAAHVMMDAFGLPAMRTRPAQLYINGEYIGFYTIMEPPTSGAYMQVSHRVSWVSWSSCADRIVPSESLFVSSYFVSVVTTSGTSATLTRTRLQSTSSKPKSIFVLTIKMVFSMTLT